MSDLELRDAVVETRTIVRELKDQLLGNGQPGEIDKIKDRITTIEEEKNKARGAFATMKWIVAAIGGTEIGHIFFGKHP